MFDYIYYLLGYDVYKDNIVVNSIIKEAEPIKEPEVVKIKIDDFMFMKSNYGFVIDELKKKLPPIVN